MNQWQIGGVKITRVVEMETMSKATFVLPDATPENIQREPWLQPHFADSKGRVRMSIHALVVESDGKRIVVDTCLGNDKPRMNPPWNMLQTSFLTDLESAGFPRPSITDVLCTHLHVDHVGWNTMLAEGRWIPTFANARYLIGRKEWAHWSVATDKFTKDPIDDSVRPIVDADSPLSPRILIELPMRSGSSRRPAIRRVISACVSRRAATTRLSPAT